MSQKIQNPMKLEQNDNSVNMDKAASLQTLGWARCLCPRVIAPKHKNAQNNRKMTLSSHCTDFPMCNNFFTRSKSPMEVIKNLKPGENGTKRYQQKYGERLLCVRYRIDKETGKRYTTVELIVDQAFYRPKAGYEKELFPSVNRHVYVRIAYEEKDLQAKIRQAGGKWIKDKKRWKITYHKAKTLGLIDRIEEVGG